MALMDKHMNQRTTVNCDHALKFLVTTSQQKCKTAAEIYQDKDGMRTLTCFAGRVRARSPGSALSAGFLPRLPGRHLFF